MPTIRKAALPDVLLIHKLINRFAESRLMLPRPLGELYENMRDFTVAVEKDRLAGCGALHIVWDDLGEIKCLAVCEDFQKMGLGKTLVEALMEEAKALDLRKVFSLTYQPDFFVRLGFSKAAKETLPHKVWSECIRCPRFPDCGEEAVTIEIG